MAIGVIFDFPGGTTKQYDEVTHALNNGRPLPDKPVIFPAHNVVSQ